MWRSIRAVKPFPVEAACQQLKETSIFYFEVRFGDSEDSPFHVSSWTRIGLADASVGSTGLNQQTSLKFAMNESGEFLDQKETGLRRHVAPNDGIQFAFDSGDTVGCGLQIRPGSRHIFYTKNGVLFGTPILLGPDDGKMDLYPAVSTTAWTSIDLAAEFEEPWFLYHLTNHKIIE